MGTTRVKGPDGHIYPVTHPDGASDEEIISYAQRMVRPDPVQKVADSLNPMQRAAVGFNETVGTAAGRVAGLLGGIDNKAAELLGQEQPAPGPLDKFSDQMARNRELTSKVGGASAFAGRVAPAIIGGVGIGGGLGSQAAYGAATGGLTAEDPMIGAGLGAAGAGLGNLVARSGSRIAQGLRGKWADRAIQGTDETSNSLRGLARLGFKFTPGQASGKLGRQMADEVAATNVILGSAHRDIARHNQDLLTKYAARAVGVNTDDIGPKALQAMDDAISQSFDDVAKMVNGVDVPPEVAKLADDLLPVRTLKDVGLSNGGPISGRQYMSLRSKLLEVTRNAREHAKQKEAWDAIEQLDDAVERVAPGEFKGLYAAARERFKTMLTLEKFKRGVNSDGKINAKTADSAAQDIFGKMYTRAQKPLLPETGDFLTALRGMASDRMTTNLGGSPTAARVSLLGTAGLLGFAGGAVSPAAGVAAIPAAYATSRALMSAPSSIASRHIGGGIGRMLPFAAEELSR